MKKFTKFLAFVFVLFLAFVLIGCKREEEKEKTPEDLKTAISYIDNLYRNKAAVTSSDFDVIAKSTGLDITWTVTVTKGPANSVTVTLNEEGTLYKVDVNEKTEVEVEYTLRATVTNADGKSAYKEYSFKIPQFRELTYAEYMAANVNDNVVIKGVVTAIISKTKGNTYNCLYLQDQDGGYYAYGLKSDPYAEGENKVEVGMTVRVIGVKDIYSGTVEIKDGAYEILDRTIKTVTPADYTQAYANATKLTDAALVAKQAILVKIDNVELAVSTAEDLSSGYYRFKVGNLNSYARISSSVCPLTKAEQTAFVNNHKVGYLATVTGVVCVYDGQFYLTPVTSAAFSNLQLPTKSDADAVAFEKESLVAPITAATNDTEITLQTAGLAYSEQVSVAWSTDKDYAVVSEDGKKLTITLPEEAGKFTLTATLTAGEATDTVTFEVSVDAAVSSIAIPHKVETMAAGSYVFYMNTKKAGLGYLFATGELTNQGALVASDKGAKAAKFAIAAVEGKENTYTIKLGDKYLVAYRNGNYNNLKFDDAAGEWVFNTTVKTFTATINYEDNGTAKSATVYFGTYTNKGTTKSQFGLSELKYIEGDNASKIDDTQFPGYAATLTEGNYVGKKVETLAAGDYIFFMNTEKALGGKLYATGELTNQGAIVATDKAVKAVKYTVAAVEGKENTYTIKLGDKYLVAYRNGNYNNLKFDDAAGEWVFNATLKIFTATINYEDNGTAKSATVYFGTYTNKGTTKSQLGLSELKYIEGDNASKIDDTQFPGYVGTLEEAEYVPAKAEAAAAGEYFLYADTRAVGMGYIYATGELTNQGALVVTDKVAKAVKFTIAAVEGKENTYTIKLGDKYLVAYRNGNYNNLKFDDAAGEWVFDATVKTFKATINYEDNGTAKSATVYFGTYTNKGTTKSQLGLSELKYIEGDNASKIDVSQFPAYAASTIELK